MAVGDLNRDGFEDIVSVATFDIPDDVPLKLTPVRLGSLVDDLALGVKSAVPTRYTRSLCVERH